MFVKQSGIDGIHVPFRGAAQTIPAMLAGDVNFAIDNLASYVAVIQSGKMRALAVTSAQRWPTLPDIPTMGEAFVLPAVTPRPIVDRVSATQRQIAGEQVIQERFLVAGARVLSSTPEGAIAFAAKERTMWKDVVAASGAKVD
jgi:tripartite-type tricarboxylate transporter receptor subunit TctC